MNNNNELEPLSKINEQVEVTNINGRTQIVFKKALLKGKVSSNEVLNTILMAAKMQAEYLITHKLARGMALDSAEVKMLKELAEITKLEVKSSENLQTYQENDINKMKEATSTILLALSSKKE